MAVRAEQRLPRRAETLQVDLVTDAVSRPGKVNAVFGRNRLKEAVVIGILKPGLQHVVIHVADRKLGAHPRDAHRLKLQIGHRSGGVLGERLVHPESDLGPRLHFAFHKMFFDDFVGERTAHLSPQREDNASGHDVERQSHLTYLE